MYIYLHLFNSCIVNKKIYSSCVSYINVCDGIITFVISARETNKKVYSFYYYVLVVIILFLLKKHIVSSI